MRKLLVLALVTFSFSAVAREKLEMTKTLFNCKGRVELWSSDARGVETYYLKFLMVQNCSKVDVGNRMEDFAQNTVSKVMLTNAESLNWRLGKSNEMKLVVHSNSRAHQDTVYVKPTFYNYSAVATPVSSTMSYEDTYRLSECRGTLVVSGEQNSASVEKVDVTFTTKYCDKVRLDGRDYDLDGSLGNYSSTFSLSASEFARAKTEGIKFKVFSYGFFTEYDSVDNLMIKIR